MTLERSELHIFSVFKNIILLTEAQKLPFALCLFCLLKICLASTIAKLTHKFVLFPRAGVLKWGPARKMKTEFLAGSVSIYRKRGNDFKPKENRFRLTMWKKGFTVRIVKQWNGLPGAVVDAPSPETFKVRLGGVLSSLISWKASMLFPGKQGNSTWHLIVPFNLNLSMII